MQWPFETPAYIGLGSNEGARERALGKAIGRLKIHPEITVSAVSPVYETDPIGMAGGPFLNAVVAVITTLTAEQLLRVLNDIEKSMGRVRYQGRKTSRVIDLDLLLFGETVSTNRRLTLPHPRMKERRFVLIPLTDLAPELRIPGEGCSVAFMAEKLAEKNPEQVVRLIGALDQKLMEPM
jgi:2-amino-4-hydroxy-6-hydroxymethyldihydropteridine diphosphokinase